MPRTVLPATTITNTGVTNVTTPVFLGSAVIECWGSGGRGGERTTNGVGGGGSGGGYSKSTLTNLVQMTSYPFSVGIGSSTTAAGQDTTFNTTAVVAKGGASCGNNTATGATAVDNVSLGTGTTKYNGGAGGTGSGTTGGGGGEGAATTSNGNNGSSPGAGGTGTDGGDGGAGKASPQGSGGTGLQPGGAGGGAYRSSSGTRAGGQGGSGQARYQWIIDRKDHMLMLGCG